jgi:hypothetical protein
VAGVEVSKGQAKWEMSDPGTGASSVVRIEVNNNVKDKANIAMIYLWCNPILMDIILHIAHYMSMSAILSLYRADATDYYCPSCLK